MHGGVGDLWRSQGHDPFLRFYTFHKHVQTPELWQQAFLPVHLSNIQFVGYNDATHEQYMFGTGLGRGFTRWSSEVVLST